ncbi:MAG TPA: NADH-quinone oxidoreductase subunit H [Candidatus Omnitrophota bacterium]|nr:NADH-quinone oxidoreductase subunit H [Candidatus Omnitrophota bacterium]
MLSNAFPVLFHWLILCLLSPFFLGVIAKVKAFFSGKVGPSVFQPYFDLAKLFRKKCVYSHTITWIFRVAPAVVLAVMLVFSLLVPFGRFTAPVQFSGDILLAVYLLALGRFFMILAALDTGSSFEGMGASREAFFSCLSELALFMNFITLALLAKSLSLSQMIGSGFSLSFEGFDPALFLVIASFFIVLLAENCRIPVDDPETHLELTMIHEVMILDHSGVDLAYMLYAAAMKLFIFSGILVSLIIPVRTGHPVTDTAIFLCGILGLAVFVGIVESSMARLRLNRVRLLLLISFALAFFGLIVSLWRA